jgi:aminoglycoside phosphotransferase (APT) family kinase protein
VPWSITRRPHRPDCSLRRAGARASAGTEQRERRAPVPRCPFVFRLISSSSAPAEEGKGVRGPPGPGDEHGLEEQAVASRSIGVQAERIVAVDELADVAREHGDEEETHCEAEQGSTASYDDQRRTERDLDEAGQDHHHVLVDPDPIGHLSLEVVAGKRQVAEPGDDECATEDDPCSGADASRSSDGHCSYRTASRAPIWCAWRTSNTVPGVTSDAVPHRVSQSQAQEFLAGKYGAVEELRSLRGGFWSSAYAFSHAGRELVLRFGPNKDWFEADRAALAFASRDLPVPEVIEVGEAFDGVYAISVRCYGINLEDVRPDQADTTGPMLASLLAALYNVPKSSDLPVRWHERPSRSNLTWRGSLSERLEDEPHQKAHGWRAALADHSDLRRVARAAEARVSDLIEACPERRDLIHGDLLHANVLVTEDASHVNAVFSWKRSLRGDFPFDTAWCTFCCAIWYPGIAAANPWDHIRREPSIRNDADAWIDAAVRRHCYELHIGLTALAWNVSVGDLYHRQIATQLAVVLERGPLPDHR